MGALKGKLQYMSPEQAWGRAVDARSDIFSLGAVLFEMLTGERLFTGDTEMSVLEAVRQGEIRSIRQIDPSIPAEVDEIADRALADDPQNRFASAGEMKQRIEAVLHTLGLSPGPTDLAAYVQRVLEEEPASGDWSQSAMLEAEGIPGVPVVPAWPAAVPEPPPIEAFAEVDDGAEDFGGITGIPSIPGAVPDFAAYPDFAAPESSVPFEPQPVAAVAPVGEIHLEEPARRSRNLLFAAIAVLAVLAVLTFYLLLRRPAPGGSPAVQEPSSQPAPAPAVQVPATTPAPAAPATKAPGLSQEEIEKMVKAEMAKREASIRRTKEAELEKYRKEIERMQAEARKKKEAADAAANEGEPPPPRR
jgi:hypothetical protein